MTRALWIVVALAACGKKSDTNAGAGSGGAVQNGPAGADEPKTPPPPPTIKQGKGDCKTEYAPRPTRDPNPMCKVDGGTLEMVDFKDKMTVKLSPYLIDQFEVTNAQVAHYLNATKAENCSAPNTERDPCFRLGRGDDNSDIRNGRFIHKRPDGTYSVIAGFERVAFNRASRQGAMEYCAWAGKALPTEPQWEFAARRDPATNQDYLYPWGNEFDGRRARCVTELCPLTPGDENDQSRSNRPAPVGSFDGTGEFGDGRSPWGLFDMAGNVDEVVADCGYAYKACNGGSCVDPPPHPPLEGRCEVITRGGGIQAERQLRTVNRGSPMGAGFRCAKPAS